MLTSSILFRSMTASPFSSTATRAWAGCLAAILMVTGTLPLNAAAADATIPDSLFVAADIAGAKSVVDVKRDAKKGDVVVMAGRIGGSKKPFVNGRAVFTIADLSLSMCSEISGDRCPTPWDFCCEERKSLIAKMATVEFVDSAGKPLATGASGVHGLATGSMITVKGAVRDVSAGGLLVIDAAEVFVHPAGTVAPVPAPAPAPAPAPVPAPAPAPGLSLPVIEDGTTRSTDPWADPATKTLVIFFINTDCPIANTLQPEIKRIIERFPGGAIKFYSAYPDAAVTAEKAAVHGKKFSIPTPLVLDPSQELAKRFGVTVTPEVLVLGAGNQTIYRGRINDLYRKIGQREPAPTSNDLRDTLDAISRGETPEPRTTAAIGCFLAPLAAP